MTPSWFDQTMAAAIAVTAWAVAVMTVAAAVSLCQFVWRTWRKP